MKIKDLKTGDFFIHPQSTSNPKCICMVTEDTESGMFSYAIISGSCILGKENMTGALSSMEDTNIEQDIHKLDLNNNIDMIGLIISLFYQQNINRSVC